MPPEPSPTTQAKARRGGGSEAGHNQRPPSRLAAGTLVEILVPEGEGVLHVHHFEDEGFYILEGEMTFYVGEQTIRAQPGSFLFGPKDVPHAFTVDRGPARLLFIFTPAGLEGGIREMESRQDR